MKIVINREGIKELLNAPGVVKDLEARAERIAEAAGPGMETRPSETARRARVAVITATPDAARREAKERALTRALDAGR